MYTNIQITAQSGVDYVDYATVIIEAITIQIYKKRGAIIFSEYPTITIQGKEQGAGNGRIRVVVHRRVSFNTPAAPWKLLAFRIKDPSRRPALLSQLPPFLC